MNDFPEYYCSICGAQISKQGKPINGLIFIHFCWRDKQGNYVLDGRYFIDDECAKRYKLKHNMEFKSKTEFNFWKKMIDNKEKT